MLANTNKLNAYVTAMVGRGVTKTTIAAGLGVSPRQLGRLQSGERPLTEDVLVELDRAISYNNLSINGNSRSRAKDVPGAKPKDTAALAELQEILSLAPAANLTKTAIAQELMTNRRTLDRWATGASAIPDAMKSEISDFLKEIKSDTIVVEQAPKPAPKPEPVAPTATVAPKTDVVTNSLPALTHDDLVNYVTVTGGFTGGMSTLARSVIDADPRLSLIKGLDNCDILVNKSKGLSIAVSYLNGDDQQVADYFRQAISFKEGDAAAYVVVDGKQPIKVRNVAGYQVELAKNAIRNREATVQIGDDTFNVKDVLYIILSPEFNV